MDAGGKETMPDTRGEAGSQNNKTSFLCLSAQHFKFQISPFEIKDTDLKVLKKQFLRKMFRIE